MNSSHSNHPVDPSAKSGRKVEKPSSVRLKRAVLALTVLLLVGLLFSLALERFAVPPEPAYQGKTLRQWIAAFPGGRQRCSRQDLVSYRRTALRAMGDPALRYLHWMILHPGQTIEGHLTWMDRASSELPAQAQMFLLDRGYAKATSFDVVFAFECLGRSARMAAPDLVRLWESGGRLQYETDRGFALALAEIGSSSPDVLAALDRHLNSDRLPRIVSALAAVRLDRTDERALTLLRRELSATPYWAIRSARECGLLGPSYLDFAAASIWRRFHDPAPARKLIEGLVAESRQSEPNPGIVSWFTSAAIELAEVPGIPEAAAPMLKELSGSPELSIAKGASDALTRFQQLNK